ncbi:hypothetical protein E4T52_10876 [Aureobasidium sp. EXF-3400]|nr:hypothetical protein E4T51_09700 [Aureobasidium sp. EXF-12344]KAI4774160.1 hypothetical protein E4T52_10876 [Aureobasidium sp. EXF-3400]
MDLILDGDMFYCKLSTSARLIRPAKKVPVYLFLDTGHVDSLKICDNTTEAIPPSVASDFVERAICTSSDDIVGLQFRLERNAPLFAPDSLLQKRRSTCDEIKNLLRIGQYETFVVYVSTRVIDKVRLSSLCLELAKGTLKPVSEGVIKSLYHPDTTSRVITHLDQLSSLYPQELPPYDPLTAPGASNDQPSGPIDPTISSSSRGLVRRRSISPDLHQAPSKRQLLTEKAAPEQPWELAIAALGAHIAAQGAQMAALQAELSALRGEVQQQRAPGVDAETQTDHINEHESEIEPEADISYVSHSPASTVEMTTDDRLNIMEGNIDERFKRSEILLGRLDAKLNDSNQEIKKELELETFSLNFLIEDLNSRVCDLENDLQDDLRKEFEEAIETKGSDLQVKLEDFIENKLEDVEEIVKQDVRIALGNAKYDFSIEF